MVYQGNYNQLKRLRKNHLIFFTVLRNIYQQQQGFPIERKTAHRQDKKIIIQNVIQGEEKQKQKEAKRFQSLFFRLSEFNDDWVLNYEDLIVDFLPFSEYLARLRTQDDQFQKIYRIIKIMNTKDVHYDQWVIKDILKCASFGISVTELCSIFLLQAENITDFESKMRDLLQLFKWMFTASKSALKKSSVSMIFNLQKIIECYYQRYKFTQLFNEYDTFLKDIYISAHSMEYKKTPSYPVALEFIQIQKDKQLFGKLEKLNTESITLEKYLDYHYFIIREDYIRNLRIPISSLSESGFQSRIDKEATRNINLYQNIQLISASLNNNELIWGISLKQFNMDGRIQKQIDWKRSNKLTQGSLICLTNIECYPLIFGVITNRDENQPKYKNEKIITLEFKFIDPNIFFISFLNLFSQKTIVIEYENLVEPILSYLEALKLKNQYFPFQEVIIYGSKNIDYPLYLKNGSTWQIDLSNNKFYRGTCFDILEQNWPQLQSSLDQSQFDAIKLMLQQEVALVQGPPGTGKTFCGALAVRLLAENLQRNNLPILIVCYTNHALDQFLEHILKFLPVSQVARLGGRSKNPEIQQCQFRCQTRVTNFEWGKLNNYKSLIYDILDRMLRYDYKVASKDLKQIWPSLWYDLIGQFIEDNGLIDSQLNKKSQRKLITCWLEGRVPEGNIFENDNYLIGTLDYFTNERITSGVKIKNILQTETQQILSRIVENVDDDIDQIMDSEEEQTNGNNFDGSPQEMVKKINDAIRNFNEYQQNRNELYYDYDGINNLKTEIIYENPWFLNPNDIKQIIRYIKSLKYKEDSVLLDRFYKEFKGMSSQLKTIQDKNEIDQLQNIKIVGVTITGVARQIQKLQKLNSKVMIIEEAAEVLESHIASILTPNLQHLILIGDHQQLQPKLQCYQLEQKFQANISLFEKLFKNNIPCVKLTQQRRMKKSFSDFIRLIYGNSYQDHSDIFYKQQVSVKGLQSDLLFFNHKWPETSDQQSKDNKIEGEMIFAMVQYLLKLGYDQSSISVLTLYLRQAQVLKRKLIQANCKKIKVQTVDNYQGEENDIVIVSLVRNNQNKKLGYIKIENRINVALSRAKYGLYIFGNFDFIYENSLPQSLWHKVINLAKLKKCLKNSIQIKCIPHGNIQELYQPSDWSKVNAGCCNQQCNLKFEDCDHICKKMCHLDDHTADKCPEQCERTMNCGHRCKLICGIQCQCTDIVRKVLNCGHHVQAVCSSDLDTIKCENTSQIYFLQCNHTVSYKCCDKENFLKRCKHKCEKILSCSHSCQKYCYEDCYPCKQTCKRDRICGHQSICTNLCYQPCTPCSTLVRYKLNCNHYVKVKCEFIQGGQVNIGNYQCQKKCKRVRLCGHLTPCTKLCFEECTPCNEEVMTKLECGHSQPIPCSIIQQQKRQIKNWQYLISNIKIDYQCKQIIQKQLKCGHTQNIICSQESNPIRCQQQCLKIRNCQHNFPCNQVCGEECSPCQQLIPTSLTCGHIYNFKCYSKASEMQFFQCYQCVNQRPVSVSQNHNKNMCTQVSPPCQKQVLKTLDCNHILSVKCCDFYNSQQCTVLIKRKIQCGHFQEVLCFQKHQNIPCSQPCIKIRSCSHKFPCSNQCSSLCSPCEEIVQKQCQNCFRTKSVKCHQYMNSVCNEEIQLRLRCKHFIQVKCYQQLLQNFECQICSNERRY